jgi:hypothetical protein
MQMKVQNSTNWSVVTGSDRRAFEPRTTMSKDTEGNIITSKAQILGRWVTTL